jgi:membrane protein YqaA with SNARE-associated domain
MKRLYDWMMRLAADRRALPALAIISFAESSFFPIPPDNMLVPMVLAARRRAFVIAATATLASVVGGLLGYAIGYYAFETIGEWVVRTYGLQSALESFRAEFEQYGTWIILIKGLTPIPYKLVTIASGLAGVTFPLFMLYSTITRSFRYIVIEALLVTLFGDQAKALLEKYLEAALVLFLVVLVLGFVVLRYL